MSLLVIGQAPSRIMQSGDRPLEGTSALTRLAGYAGVTPRERLYELADFINVIEEYPGPQPGNEKYDAYPQKQALDEGRRIVPMLENYDRVVVLGKAATTTMFKGILGLKVPEWFEPVLYPAKHTTRLYASPHPGGTSMWWNTPSRRQQGMIWWRQAFKLEDKSGRSVDGVLSQPQSSRKTPTY